RRRGPSRPAPAAAAGCAPRSPGSCAPHQAQRGRGREDGHERAEDRAGHHEVGLLGAVVGYGLTLSVNFTIAGSTCLAAFLAGILVAETATKSGESRWVPRGVAALAAVAVVVLGAASIGERFILDGIRESHQGNLSAAENSFTHARSLRPLDPDVAMLAAQSLAALANDEIPGAGKATRTWAGRSLEHTPKTYASNMALAVTESHDHDFAGALARLDRLAKWYPIQPGVYVQRGIVKFALGDLSGSFADLRHATGLDPKDPTAGRILQRIKTELGARAQGR
ncbi:MAG: tetratricopeptide repeat protein, partial [Marmoricola sp.]